MAVFDNIKGISVASGFKLQAQSPLDPRLVVDNISDRDLLVTENGAYEGMKVYVKSDKKTYELQGTTNSDWVEVGGKTSDVSDLRFEISDAKGSETSLKNRIDAVEATANTKVSSVSVGNGLSKTGDDKTPTIDVKVDPATDNALKKTKTGLKVKDYTVTVETSAGTDETDYSTSYVFKQLNKTLATINIPKDMVVSNGEIVTYTKETKPAEVATAGTYIVLTIANATSDKLYINVSDLLDDKTIEGVKGTDISVTADSSEGPVKITATINEDAVQTKHIADSAVTADKICNDAVTIEKIASAAKTTTIDKASASDTTIPTTKAVTDYVDTAIGEGAVQTVSVSSGTNNGTIKVTVDGTATDNIAVTGWDTKADEVELERIKYYGDPDIIPSSESYFTVNETGETITGLTNTGKTQTGTLVIPYKINGIIITTLFSGISDGPPMSILDGATDKITKVVIPDSVTSIGDNAFYNCTSLASITIPDSVTSIGDNAFYNCRSLASITIPDSVTSICNEAFYDCRSLKNVTIPDSVTSIGVSAFYNCRSLTSVNIPNSVTSIGEHAFYNCRSLTSVNIPNSVTSIGEHAFHSCSSLVSITIPNSVTSIGVSAFDSISSNAVFYVEQGIYAETYAKEKGFNIAYTGILKTELDAYAKKPDIVTSADTTYSINFLADTNSIIRLTSTELTVLELNFYNGEYDPSLCVNLVFTSGATAPQISYPKSGILTWVGTDCALTNEGRSVFIPSPNTRYDIVISFDGTDLLGEVCGYTPATLDNKESTGPDGGSTN